MFKFKNDKLPESWLQFLAKVQTQFPEAVIAGGALRDVQLGKHVKDVDIFVQSRGQKTRAMLELAVDREARPMNPEWVKKYEEQFTELFAVYENLGHDFNGAAFQVIALNMDVTLDTVVDRIDFGICRIAHNGQNYLITEEFMLDARNETFTLINAGNRDGSINRFYRLTADYGKYEGWRPINLFQSKSMFLDFTGDDQL